MKWTIRSLFVSCLPLSFSSLPLLETTKDGGKMDDLESVLRMTDLDEVEDDRSLQEIADEMIGVINNPNESPSRIKAAETWMRVFESTK